MRDLLSDISVVAGFIILFLGSASVLFYGVYNFLTNFSTMTSGKALWGILLIIGIDIVIAAVGLLLIWFGLREK